MAIQARNRPRSAPRGGAWERCLGHEEPNLQEPATWYMQHMWGMGLEETLLMKTFYWSWACLSIRLGLMARGGCWAREEDGGWWRPRAPGETALGGTERAGASASQDGRPMVMPSLIMFWNVAKARRCRPSSASVAVVEIAQCWRNSWIR